jgi:adenylate kinase
VAIDHIKSTLKEKYGDSFDDEQIQEAAECAMQEYHMNIKDVEEVFKNVIHMIDAHGYVKGYSEEQNKVSHFVEQISRMIQMKRMSPDRRLRIIIIGAPGSGRSTQAEQIAKKYGLVHISTSNLLKNEIRLKTERGKRIKECFTNSKLVPDEIICSLIEARIKQNDCKLNGWVLDGFPKTIQQITVLKAMKIKPTRVIILECDKEICAERILKREFDPVTGKVYNMIDSPPEDREILGRLVPYFPDMTKEKVEKRWDIWNQFQVKVQESYQELVLKFNTEEYNVAQVTSNICEFLENPMF